MCHNKAIENELWQTLCSYCKVNSHKCDIREHCNQYQDFKAIMEREKAKDDMLSVRVHD